MAAKDGRVQVVVLKQHTYERKPRSVGAKYRADPRLLPLMKKLGWVREARA